MKGGALRVASSVVVAMALMTGLSVATASPAVAAPAWSIVPSASPAGAPSGSLQSVACASVANCFAVGSYVSGQSGGALIERWDGSSWSIDPAPTPDTSGGTYGNARLNDIACPGPSSCFAVGSASTDGHSTTLIEGWNGSTWSIVPSPSPPSFEQLDSVACSSPTHCFAVTISTTQVEEWNGSTWSIAKTAPVTGSSGLAAVTCASSSCFAVGMTSTNGGRAKFLSELWNGSAWSIVPGASPANGFFLDISAVSCATATSCFAVGEYSVGSSGQPRTIIEQWNGASWSVVVSPTPPGSVSSELADVSCSSTTDCFAVGLIGHGQNPNGSSKPVLTLTEHWNGASWTIVAGPNPDPKSNDLNGVSCTSSTSCFAVGSTGSLSRPAIVASWNGVTWSTPTIPLPAPSVSTLSAVSCASATTCFAVGQYTTGGLKITSPGATRTLIEQSGPAGWSVVPSPNPAGSTSTTLSGISCPSATVCFAVGSSSDPSLRTLVERWNGHTWSIVSSPSDARFGGRLTNISCTSAKSCFAVGRKDAFTIETLVERWNGSKWTIVPSPSRRPSPQFETAGINNLEGISCSSASSCFAVGNDSDYLYTMQETLVLRWNGAKWSIVKSPNGPGAKYSDLASISCVSANNCYAVGNGVAKGTFPAPTKSLVEHWNGTAWTRVADSDPASARQYSLSGIACAGPTSCVAVGFDAGTTGRQSTLVKSLSGTKWSIVASPNPAGASNTSLHSVTCPTPAHCFAVGDSDAFSAPVTLVESYG